LGHHPDEVVEEVFLRDSSREQLIAEALHRLIQEFRDAMDVQPSDLGDPTERLASFVRLLFDIYARQGASLSTLLDHRDDPQIDAQITDQRLWRRRQLDHILRDAKAELLLPLPHAVAIAFVLTNHASWKTLTEESGLTQPKAVALTTNTLEAALFGHRPS
jgi:AcrR family transcriptional regulator